MDDDERDNEGLGGLAWYQLGKWQAESGQRTRELCARLGGNAPVARADYDLLDEEYHRAADYNEQLAAANQHLIATVSKLQLDIECLTLWATDRAAGEAAQANLAAAKAWEADENARQVELWKERYEALRQQNIKLDEHMRDLARQLREVRFGPDPF